MRQIVISPVLNGFVVNCGCQTVVYDSPERMLGDLAAYLQDPEGTEKRILESSCNRQKLGKAPETANVLCDGARLGRQPRDLDRVTQPIQ